MFPVRDSNCPTSIIALPGLLIPELAPEIVIGADAYWYA